MKVLLSAYSCLPDAGSEQAIGWNWARSIAASGHNVVVLTRVTHRQRIETFCAKHECGPVRFAYFDLSAALQKIYKLPFGNYLYYTMWQKGAAQYAAALHQSEQFEKVQHITWGSFRVPSFMGKLGIPFTFGPVAGGEDTPKNLRAGLGWRGRFWDFLRRTSDHILLISPWVKSTFRDAAEIVATTPETLRKIPGAYRAKGKVQQAIGIDDESVGGPARSATPAKTGTKTVTKTANLELLFVGRLLPWKGLHLALKALAAVLESDPRIRLTVVGAGYDEPRLKRLARTLKVEQNLSWIPWVKREDLIEMYPRFDLFVFPSLHDSGGIAVLEALYFGLPVVCLDLGGPAVSVNSTCGRVISTAGLRESEVVSEIAGFVKQMRVDPDLRSRLSQRARLRAKELTWQAQVNRLYGKGSRVPVELS
jgi:glycosyltransferase involved in cell wall biosynthesis